MKCITFLAVLLLTCACSHPRGLQLQLTHSEIVEIEKTIHFSQHDVRKIAAPTLVLTIRGKAPFAFIENRGFQAQFRCRVIDVDNRSVSDIGFGNVHFAGKARRTDGIVDSDGFIGNDENYLYKIFVYRDLKAWTTVNVPPNLDLLKDRYDHVQCNLVGVQMFGPFIYSNDIIFSKEQILKMYAHLDPKVQYEP